MAEKEQPLAKFYRCVNGELARRLEEAEAKIRAISGEEKRDDIANLLTEANSLISLACGDDENLYEVWRYRMFVDPDSGKITIIQGDEIDVDYREWMESGIFFQIDDDDDSGRDDYDDDDY